MTGFLRAALYLIVTGFAAFLIGRILPKHWFHGDAFPYRDYPFEQKGNLYRKLYIQKWHTRVPDMSRLFRRWMPPKRLPANPTSAQIELMVQETCVAEFTHLALLAVGLPVLWLWPGPGGIALYAVDALLGNGIFILIQRFNRPKLMHLCERLKKRGL